MDNYEIRGGQPQPRAPIAFTTIPSWRLHHRWISFRLQVHDVVILVLKFFDCLFPFYQLRGGQPWAASTATISRTPPHRTLCVPSPTRTTCRLLIPMNPISTPFLLPFLPRHRPLHDRPVRSGPSASSTRPTRSQAPRTSSPTMSVS